MSDISHAASSSSEVPACADSAVEQDSVEDVSKIVSYPTLTRQLSLTRALISYVYKIKPNAFRGEMWRTRHESGIFLHKRRTYLDVTFQLPKSRFHVWNS